MRVREAGPQDVPAVSEIEAALFGADSWSTAAVAEELGAARQALVALDGDADVVGYAVVAVAGELADLHRIAVVPAHRRRGVASALLAAARAGAREAGATRMLLEVAATNEDACAFYAAEGWSELDRRRAYYRDGDDALVMSIDLQEPA